jgi:transposase-like protein
MIQRADQLARECEALMSAYGSGILARKASKVSAMRRMVLSSCKLGQLTQMTSAGTVLALFSASAISGFNKKLDEGLGYFALWELDCEYPCLILDARYESEGECSHPLARGACGYRH